MISGLVDIRDFVKKAPCSLAIHHISCICAPPRRQIQPAQKTLYQRSSSHLDCSLEKTHVGERSNERQIWAQTIDDQT